MLIDITRSCLHCNNKIHHDSMKFCYFCTTSLFQNDEYKIHIKKFIKSCIRLGIIKKRLCIVCNEKAEFHITNYFKPLEITWLCKICHKDAHCWHKDFLESKLC